MSYHAAPPPLPLDNVPRKPKLTKAVRQVCSPPFARFAPHGWARLLCCFDDESQSSRCQRPDCQYTHVGEILEGCGLPIHETFNWTSCFRHLPCTFAGMDGGCRYHPYNFSHWGIPQYALTPLEESTPGVLPIHSETPSQDEELILFRTDAGWTVQNRTLGRCMLDSVREYLQGCNDQEGD